MGVFCSVFCSTALAYFCSAYFDYRCVSGRRKALARNLNELKLRSFYPCQENLEELERRCDQLHDEEERQFKIMRECLYDMPAVEPAGFPGLVQQWLGEIRNSAMQRGVQVLPDFHGGFYAYAHAGMLPKTEYVSRLCAQLEAVVYLAHMLIDAEIVCLEGVVREPFEQRMDAENIDGSDLRCELYDVDFIAQEQAVWNVLCALANVRRLMVVSNLSVQTQTEILSYVPVSQPALSEQLRRWNGVDLFSNPDACLRSDRLLAGDELVRVKMTLKVYGLKEGGEE